jgi:hypothetical protein
MSVRRRAGLLALVGALGGCAGLGNILKEPDIRLNQVVVRSIGMDGGNLDLLVDVDNPNGFDLRGTEVELGFDVEGSHVGNVHYSDDSVWIGAVGQRSPCRCGSSGPASAVRYAPRSARARFPMR